MKGSYKHNSGNSYLKTLSIKLGVPENKIKGQNVKYYYTKWPQLCCNYDLKPLLDSKNNEVGPFEFNKAINILNDYYKNIKSDYFRKLVEEAKKYKDGETVLGKETNEDLDHLMKMVMFTTLKNLTFTIMLLKI